MKRLFDLGVYFRIPKGKGMGGNIRDLIVRVMSKEMFCMSEFKLGNEFDELEFGEWELEERFREGLRYVGEKRGRDVHPYAEKVREKRRKELKNEHIFSKENTKTRRSINRLKRKRLARGAYDDLTIRPRDYKTYGYETW